MEGICRARYGRREVDHLGSPSGTEIPSGLQDRDRFCASVSGRPRSCAFADPAGTPARLFAQIAHMPCDHHHSNVAQAGLDSEHRKRDRPPGKGTSMTIKAHAPNRFGADLFEGYDHNLSRARIAGYVLLTGLLLEVVASLIW